VAIIAFGDYQLDTRTLELRNHDRKIHLRPQPCRVLALLAGRPGQLVTRQELRDVVWPTGVYVRFDLGLNSCLKQIRRALGESALQPRFLETLSGRGYRFVGEVRIHSDEPIEPVSPPAEVDHAVLLESLTELQARVTAAIAQAIAALSAARPSLAQDRAGLGEPVDHNVQGRQRPGLLDRHQGDQVLAGRPDEQDRRVRAH